MGIVMKSKIGIKQGVAILVSALLGSGVFIIPAIAATIAGSWSLLAWLVMGLIILPIVFTFAALGKKYPHAGGTAYFVQLAFSEKASRISAWLFVWVVALAAPVIVITAANFLLSLLLNIGLISDVNRELLMICAFIMLLLLLIVNLLGLKTASLIQSILSVCVVGCLLYVSVNSQLSLPIELPDTAFSLNKVALSATFILWCFLGIEAIAHLSDDFKNPQRDFPLTIVIGIVITLFVYSLISISLLQMGYYGSQQDNLNSVIDLVSFSLGDKGASLVALCGFLTCFISVSLYLVGLSRLLSSMASARQLAPLFIKQNRFSVASNGLMAGIILTALVLFVYYILKLDIENLIAYANGLFILIYLAACLAGTKLLSGGGRLFAQIGSVTCLLLFISLAEQALFALVLLLLLAIYYRYKPVKQVETKKAST